MNTKGFLGLFGVLMMAALLTMPLAARAEMYVEGYIGGMMAANSCMSPGVTTNWGSCGTCHAKANVPGKMDPAVIGGLKLGTWFVKEGFLGYDYPDWMKYLGFYLDFNYHRLNFRGQTGAYNYLGADAGSGPFSQQFSSEGNAATLAFMFAARYGFLPDAEVPFGRLQPYVAVGPAILFVSQNPTLSTDAPYGNITTLKPGSQSDAVLCLAAEAGVRWMCLKNVSVDISFKYRYAQPNFSYRTSVGWGDMYSFSLNPTLNLFSGQIGVAYHF
jgi:hypothetical protein